ncbi:MAG: hypothetical protein JF615_05935, partial [Asticcacaulis sp.]|nr:hypothetical protein [Asticcacaulis sp.]
MTFKDHLGPVARTMFALIGVLLLIVAVATMYRDWPLVETHKSSLLGFILTCLIALPLSLLVVVWAAIGRMKEWRIGDDGIRMRMMSLTAWARQEQVQPGDIADITVETFAYEDQRNRSAHWLVLTTTDGRRFKSPRVYDAMVAEVMRSRVTALKDKTPNGK